MNPKTVHDIYLEALVMQRQGLSARKIAIRSEPNAGLP
jgi:hypothetical protein